MKRSILVGFLALVLAAPLARGVELGCIGGYNFRQNGNELDTTHYRFRNFNLDRTITLTAIDVYAFDGSVLYSSSTSGFPPGLNPVIAPHQTAGFELEDLLHNHQAPNTYLQTVVTWEGDRGRGAIVPLDATAARITRQRNPTTGDQGETRARAILHCREVHGGR